MTFSQHFFLVAGALFGMLSIIAGAFASHLLKAKMSIETLHVFEMAARYQMYHALALMGLTAMMKGITSTWLIAAGGFFTVGTVVFSGSLYALVLTGVRLWGAITPIGGVLLILGWLSLLLAKFWEHSF